MTNAPFQHGRSDFPTGRTTVVITTHNYGRYLSWCIFSALAQTLRPVRVIVVDDASEDDTAEICSHYAPQIEYYRVEYRNPQKTRNFGLAKASSEFVIFLDADDFMSDRMLEQLENALDRHPDARVAYCDKYVFGDPTAINNLRLPYYWKSADFSVAHLKFKNFIMLTALVRREILVSFDERICRLQDWDTWLGILKFEKHAIRVAEPLLHYRVHGDNLSFLRQELIERLKVMAKHGLISVEPLKADVLPAKSLAPRQEVLIFAMSSSPPDLDPCLVLARTLGCRVRVILGRPDVSKTDHQTQNTVHRDRGVILQTTSCFSLDDLFWRYTGIVANPDIAAVVAVRNLADLPNPGLLRQSTEPVFRSELNLDGLLSATSLEALGSFSLTSTAACLLLYLQPPAPQTIGDRLRRQASRFLSQHIAWRLRG